MADKQLLKEAIAEAKTIKEVAIANAKAALEEQFSPFLKEKLAAKLAEMDEMDEAEDKMDEAKKEVEEVKDMDEAKDMKDKEDMKEADDKEGYEGQMGKKKLGTKEMSEGEDMEEGYDMDEAEDLDEMDLDELLAELDKELSEGEKEDMDENLINDPKGETAKGNVAEEEMDENARTDAEEEGYLDGMKDEKEDMEDEEIDLDDMSEEDLKKFIEDVIEDMVKAGELEAGEDFEDDVDVEVDVDGEIEVEDDEETAVDENKRTDAEQEGYKDGFEDAKDDIEDKLKDMKVSEAEKEMEEMKKEVDELKKELNEVNLLNSKLLYVNKIFRGKNLTENQKAKVLGAFDKATTVAEVKLVFETLNEGLTTGKAAIKENLGSASKAISTPARKPIMEVDPQISRWQKLAGIK